MRALRLATLALLASCGGGAGDAAELPDGATRAPDGATVGADGCRIPDTRALAFDGVDDGITMGNPPALGLATFTVEAWVRRDGPGSPTSTGSGGLQLVPIAGKGRGESDGGRVDCNYALGFAGDVLGADFEDTASGANHPVVGTTAIPLGEWHHVAASFDGRAFSLWLDGALEATTLTGATPRADSLQPFAIGTALDSTGAAAGRLHGAVDEVRVWDRALSSDELALGVADPGPTAAGLVARWSLGESESGGVTPDSAGDADGTLSGTTLALPGAPRDAALPVLTPLVPDGAVVPGSTADVGVAIDDPAGGEHTVRVYVRELTEAPDFTVVVMPDTQYYADVSRTWQHFFGDQTRWIVGQRASRNVVAVIQNGDIVEHGNRDDGAWVTADAAMARLEAAYSGHAHGIPYAVTVGNHDQGTGPPDPPYGATASFNAWFGVRRFSGRAYYGGHYGSDNDENWIRFTVGHLSFVVVNLQYDARVPPSAEVIAWARGVFQSHPDAIGIVNSHYLLKLDGTFGTQGRAVYEALKDLDNVQLFTCGHIPGESRRSDTFEGHEIHTILADYQSRTNGGNGWLRVWTFHPSRDELVVETYSPSLDQWERDADSQFTLHVDLPPEGGPWTDAGRAVATSRTASVTLRDLAPGKLYEWYAVVTGCGRTTRTPASTFTVAAP